MSESNGFVGRDLFMRPSPQRIDEFDVPDFGKVRIQSWSELLRSQIEASMRDSTGTVATKKLLDFKCRCIVVSVVGADNKTYLTAGDIPHLQQLDSKITNHIFDRIQAHVGLTTADVESLEKN